MNCSIRSVLGNCSTRACNQNRSRFFARAKESRLRAATGKLGLFYHVAMTVLRMHREALRLQLESESRRVEPGVRLVDGRLTAEAGFAPDAYDWICLALGELAAAAGDAQAARAHLERSRQRHRELGLDFWARRSQSRLDDLPS